jgi:hypothetical protein
LQVRLDWFSFAYIPWRFQTCRATKGGEKNYAWEDAFDLREFPLALKEVLLAVAPCLWGRANAIYDGNWFGRALGLCSKGKLPKEIADADVPLDTYEGVWPCGEDPNCRRYSLETCEDDQVRDLYLSFYRRVYGVDYPNNKCFSQQFLRACIYYFTGGGLDQKVNWAAAAALLQESCHIRHGNNPLKLTPPALRQQLQGILNVFSNYLKGLTGGIGEMSGGLLHTKASLRVVESRMNSLKRSHAQLLGCIKELATEDERLHSTKEAMETKSRGLAGVLDQAEKREVAKLLHEGSKAITMNGDQLQACHTQASEFFLEALAIATSEFNALSTDAVELEDMVTDEAKSSRFVISPKCSVTTLPTSLDLPWQLDHHVVVAVFSSWITTSGPMLAVACFILDAYGHFWLLETLFALHVANKGA